jgi:hypothetical protein
MSQSPGNAPRTLVVRLSVPAAGTLGVVAADVAARVAEYLGTQAPDPAAISAAMGSVASRVAPDSGDAEITFEFCQIEGDLLIEARCGSRSSEVRWPTPA